MGPSHSPILRPLSDSTHLLILPGPHPVTQAPTTHLPTTPILPEAHLQAWSAAPRPRPPRSTPLTPSCMWQARCSASSAGRAGSAPMPSPPLAAENGQGCRGPETEAKVQARPAAPTSRSAPSPPLPGGGSPGCCGGGPRGAPGRALAAAPALGRALTHAAPQPPGAPPARPAPPRAIGPTGPPVRASQTPGATPWAERGKGRQRGVEGWGSMGARSHHTHSFTGVVTHHFTYPTKGAPPLPPAPKVPSSILLHLCYVTRNMATSPPCIPQGRHSQVSSNSKMYH